jgi:FlaA1/EpsC-like NDP-sugar epimerase
VSILELARNLLRLVGRESENGRGIVFTGLRPGERLHERLTTSDEETRETEIDHVRLVVTPHGNGRSIHPLIPRWTRLVAAGDEGEILRFMGRRFPALRLGDDFARGTIPRASHNGCERPPNTNEAGGGATLAYGAAPTT